MNEFGTLLKTLRIQQQLTNRELSLKSRVPTSQISELENGKRQVGEIQATRLADSLGLHDLEKQHFVFSAMNQSKKRVLKESIDYPVEVLNYLPLLLQEKGIISPLIESAVISNDRLTLVLPNQKGPQIRIEIHTSLLELN